MLNLYVLSLILYLYLFIFIKFLVNLFILLVFVYGIKQFYLVYYIFICQQY